MATGNGENAPITKWGFINSGNTSSHHGRNWYLPRSHRIDIGPIFRRFCELPERIRIQWRQVIQAYIASEEIAHVLGRYQVAEAVSLSSLEGLTKSVISTYDQETREQWLTQNLELKHPKDADGKRQGLKDAIEVVAKRELGTTTVKCSPRTNHKAPQHNCSPGLKRGRRHRKRLLQVAKLPIAGGSHLTGNPGP